MIRRTPRALAGVLALALAAVVPIARQAATAAADIAFSTPSGTFQGSVSVGLSSGINGAEIHYTTDGKPPTSASPLYPGQPLTLTSTTQVRAQAFVNGAATGDGATGLYVARNFDTRNDLPLVLIDDYGKGKPGRDYVDAAAMVFDTPASLSDAPVVATRAGVHLRGQSSASFDKAPYRLELRDSTDHDADYPMLGMPADSDWVLRGPFSDKSLVREAMVLDLGREMGMAAPRYRFVELYLNTDSGPVAGADYQGVYLLEETIKNSKERLDLKQLHDTDTTLPKISGGYIFQFQWMAAEEPTLTCTGSAATCWNYLEVDDPSPLNAQQKAWLTQYLQQFNDVLHSSGYADPQTGYRAFIDVTSWIDMIILNELSRNMDAYLRSSYFYKDRDGLIEAGPLWDFDLTFAVGGYFGNDQVSGWQYQQTRSPQANDWVQRLMTDPAFVQQLKTRWQTLRQSLLSDSALNARIDALTAPLAAGAARNFQRWPNLSTRMIGPFITDTSPTWAGQVQVLRTWATQRAAWLDTAWGTATNPPPTTPPPTTPPPTTAPPTTPPPTSPPPASGSCSASYTQISQWADGFQGEVAVTAGSRPITSWTVTLTFADGQKVSQAWNATLSTSGSTVTARNVSYNGTLGAGAGTTFGFLGSWSGSNSPPTLTCSAS
jgi:hypothetical protein